uniref:Uncharacterized protein n=1 Tax=Anguilla anguilla TaxID=7936 RepID=A0A0E9UDD0_ANGAN
MRIGIDSTGLWNPYAGWNTILSKDIPSLVF